MDILVEYVPKMALALIGFYIGLKLIARLNQMLEQVIASKNMDETIGSFFGSFVNIALKILLIMTLAGIFGIQATFFVTILATMSFAVGMALQGSLGNFASGIIILIFKPYKIGDLVKLQEHVGEVVDIQIFNTIILTQDNRSIVIPNSIITSSPIENISGRGMIRVDLMVGVSYDDDIDHVRSVIQRVADNCPHISKKKPVDILVSELADSSVNFAVRPWCESQHYWSVNFYMIENIKKAFDQESINIPFPQMEMRVKGSPVRAFQN